MIVVNEEREKEMLAPDKTSRIVCVVERCYIFNDCHVHVYSVIDNSDKSILYFFTLLSFDPKGFSN